MKTLFRIRIIMLSLLALVVFSVASKAFAAVDAFLWFTDASGKVVKAQVHSDGSFSAPKFTAGTYTVSWVFNSGPRQTTSVDDGVGGRSAVGNGSSGREASAPSVSEITISYEITAPRDHASGMATGKRQHAPPIIFKNSSSERLLPTVNKKVGSIAIDPDNDGITGTVTLKDQNGKTMAMDDWHQ